MRNEHLVDCDKCSFGTKADGTFCDDCSGVGSIWVNDREPQPATLTQILLTVAVGVLFALVLCWIFGVVR